MADEDFLTNVESAFLTLFAANAVLKEYNWQTSEDNKEIKLPRGVLVLSARRDPDETPYHRIEVAIRLEGRPKRQALAPLRNELVEVFEEVEPSDLTEASAGTVTFIGKATSVIVDGPLREGLRTRTLNFVIYGVAS